MKLLFAILTFSFVTLIAVFGQSIDSLKLSDKEVPAGYRASKENLCISIQARTFYDNPSMFEMIIGKIKSKKIQSFDSESDKGSILYFEFADVFKGESFMKGLLWGEDKPTVEHPEEIFSKGNILVVWSFKKESPIKKVSMDKVKALLK